MAKVKYKTPSVLKGHFIQPLQQITKKNTPTGIGAFNNLINNKKQWQN